MSDARFAVLDTIRRQLEADPDIKTSLTESPEVAYARIPRTYQRTAQLDRDDILELFYDRLRDYDSELIFTDEAGVPIAVAKAMQEAGESLLLVPPDVAPNWLPDSVGILGDDDLSTSALDQPSVVLTGCSVAIAMSGTIVLEHGRTQGRRAATLLPDHHICVLWRDQVVETLAEAIQRITKRGAPITTIAGPSATSDIEMTRIRGVHGPRRLTAIIL